MEIASQTTRVPIEVAEFASKIGNACIALKEIIAKCGHAADAFFLSIGQDILNACKTLFQNTGTFFMSHPYLFVVIPVAIVVIAVVALIIGTIIYINNNKEAQNEEPSE